MSLLFRFDADEKTGYGHLSRCLSLAQKYYRQGCNISIASRKLDPVICSEKMSGYTVLNIPDNTGVSDEIDVLRKASNDQMYDVVVADNYSVDKSWHEKAKSIGKLLVVIDDMGGQKIHADLLVNPNLGVSEQLYDGIVNSDCVVLAGAKYALINEKFSNIKRNKPKADSKTRVLISIGATDPFNWSATILEALNDYTNEKFDISVVLACETEHLEALKKTATESIHEVNILINPDNLPELMIEAELAIGAAGVSASERMALGIPSIVLVVADNQENMATAITDMKIGVVLDVRNEFDHNTFLTSITKLIADSELRNTLISNMKNVMDMSGADRIIQEISFAMDSEVRLRNAFRSDADIIWRLANDPLARKNSVNQEQIEWDTHVSWYEKALNDKNTCIYLAMVSSDVVGYVRFNKQGKSAIISISLGENFRGKGYGIKVLTSGIKKFVLTSGVTELVANIRKNNEASNKLFLKAGFKQVADLAEDVFSYKKTDIKNLQAMG